MFGRGFDFTFFIMKNFNKITLAIIAGVFSVSAQGIQENLALSTFLPSPTSPATELSLAASRLSTSSDEFLNSPRNVTTEDKKAWGKTKRDIQSERIMKKNSWTFEDKQLLLRLVCDGITDNAKLQKYFTVKTFDNGIEYTVNKFSVNEIKNERSVLRKRLKDDVINSNE